MVIKVCGIKSSENVELLSTLKIDMVGLNFYPPSVRYISSDIPSDRFDTLPASVKKVGVFVNESIDTVNTIAAKFGLDYIQLHGDEDIDYCKQISKQHKIIKVFRIDEDSDLSLVSNFSFADYFLFDTATKHFGGSGKKFDWSKLKEYSGNTPFLLSGGIGPDDASSILEDIHPQYVGIDINSKFESAPGIKDADLLVPFVESIRSIID